MIYRKNKQPEQFNEQDWKKEIEADRILSVGMNEDNSISVYFSTASPNTITYFLEKKPVNFSLNSTSAQALLKITGHLEPGDIRSYWCEKLSKEERYHNIPSPKEVSGWLEKKEIRKVAVQKNGYIELWGYFEQEKCFTFSGEEYTEIIEKYTGPMKPGDEFHFQEDKD